jgi:hypothetical protein
MTLDEARTIVRNYGLEELRPELSLCNKPSCAKCQGKKPQGHGLKYTFRGEYLKRAESTRVLEAQRMVRAELARLEAQSPEARAAVELLRMGLQKARPKNAEERTLALFATPK